MRPILGAVVLAALVLAAGCATTPPANATTTPTTAVTPNTTTPVYTVNDSGRIVPLGLNQTLSIRLPENPTTGYSWNATVSSGLQVLDTLFTPGPAAPGLVGAGGTRTWTLRGVAAGTQRFNAVYIRPFEPNLAADQFTLTVQVG